MKKKQPAKKGFGPSRENKFGKSDKPAGNRNRSSANGERPGRASAKDNRNGDEKPSSRRSRFDGEEKPAFRQRTFNSESRPARQRSTGSDFSDKKDKAGSERPFSSFRKDGERPQRARSADKETNSGERPPRKRTYGTGAAKRNDDSAFHFHGEKKKGGKSIERDTPSGFNRKKFFDKTNERFAGKQDRKRSRKIADNDNEPAKASTAPKESIFGPGEMPLNKYVAHCGLCSRRKAVDLIKEGKITVNGKVVTEPATKVTSEDAVTMQGKKITPTKNLVYILLNKPKGYITTTEDPEGRKTVMDLIQEAAENERVYPVGRLDRNTSGLLLLTNDGELAQRLAHPKHNIKKIYQVELDKPLTKTDFDKIVAGLTLEDGVAFVDALGYVDPKDKKQVGIEIHSGKNRIVRRIFEHLEYSVEKLDRVMYAGLTKKTLNRGQWRFLNEKEVILLKHFKK
jgi:23S rRNA pseudouridine2605 synthase